MRIFARWVAHPATNLWALREVYFGPDLSRPHHLLAHERYGPGRYQVTSGIIDKDGDIVSAGAVVGWFVLLSDPEFTRRVTPDERRTMSRIIPYVARIRRDPSERGQRSLYVSEMTPLWTEMEPKSVGAVIRWLRNLE